MAIDLDFLASNVPLAKTFERDSEQGIVKHSYPLVSRFTSYPERVTSLSGFRDKLKAHAKRTHCLLKGNLDRPLEDESRAGHTERNAPTSWVCLDVDGLPGVEDPEDLLTFIPECQGVGYVLQYSASMGVVKDRGLSAHLFMLLDRPVEPDWLKSWLVSLNLNIDMLRDNIRINRIGTALVWPLDITTCQNDKLLYIAPPILRDGIRDPYGDKRFQLVKRKRSSFTPDMTELDPGWQEREKSSIINSLRQQHGFKKKRSETKIYKNTEVASKPEGVVITDSKEERGFVYFNLNGGDSWAYFHPVGNPEIIHNFKGEPPLSTKDVDPQYYERACQRAREVKQEIRAEEQKEAVEQGQGQIVLGFRNEYDDNYYIGIYDAESDTANVKQTSNLTKLHHFMVEHGETPPDVIPTWRYEFRFDVPYTIDVENKFLNKYQPPGYMRLEPYKGTKVPPTIKQLIQHVLNDNGEVYEHYINWLAFIYQYREKPGTAWLVHGTQGTGKNLLFSRVLSPVFGFEYCKTSPLDALEDQFNQQFEEAVLVLISEADVEAVRNQRRVMERLRELITDTPISIRPMRGTRYDARSFTSLMMSSNQPASLDIDEEDRRINVAPRQDEAIRPSDEFLNNLDDELAMFAAHMASVTVDTQAVRRPIQTEARRRLQLISGNSQTDVSSALLDGNLDFFLELMPEANRMDASASILADSYKKIVDEMCRHAVEGTEHRLSRNQLHVIFDYCLDTVPGSSHKFTKFLRYRGIYTERMRKDGELCYGIAAKWQPTEIVFEYMKESHHEEHHSRRSGSRRNQR